MTDQTTDFFDGIGGGSGAPSAVLANPGDYVHGEIVEMFKRPYVPYENRASGKPAKREDGSDVQQLVIILQTENRNWANVSKIPVVDPSDANSPEKDPSEDDGKRAVYVPEGKNIQFAIGRAVASVGKPFEVGGTLGVKIDNLRDTGKGNPLKEHAAVYKPKADNFFAGTPAQEQAPAQPQQQAAPEQPAAPATPPAQEQAPAAPAQQQDPWATSSAPATSEPPF